MFSWLVNKDGKTIQWGMDSLFNKRYRDNRIAICKKKYTKINSEWIKDLNVRAKPTELLEEHIDANFCDPRLGSGFLDMTSKVWATN